MVHSLCTITDGSLTGIISQRCEYTTKKSSTVCACTYVTNSSTYNKYCFRLISVLYIRFAVINEVVVSIVNAVYRAEFVLVIVSS